MTGVKLNISRSMTDMRISLFTAGLLLGQVTGLLSFKGLSGVRPPQMLVLAFSKGSFGVSLLLREEH